MKKITLLLMAMITGTAFAQNPSATATVKAEIVSPLTITATGTLNFGSIASDESTGLVIIDPTAATRTYTNSDMEIVSSSFEIPVFTVSAADGYTYGVVTTGDVLEGAISTDVMTLSNITTNLTQASGNTAESFKVGGTLEVGANQAAGTYTGIVTVTVAYE